MYVNCVTFKIRFQRGAPVCIKVANLDEFWSSDSQWSDALLNSEFLTAWNVCCLWRYQRSCMSHPSNVSFDLLTIIILMSIINDLCHNHPWSQQYLAIPNNFYGQRTTSNANIYIKINCRTPAHIFLYALHQQWVRNRRENIIYFKVTVQSLSFLHDTKTSQSSSGFVGFGCI